VCTQVANESEDASESRSGPQGAFAGSLDNRTVGYWIAEGDAEFDDVSAGFRSGQDDSTADVE
jgi:hypothetical protein